MSGPSGHVRCTYARGYKVVPLEIQLFFEREGDTSWISILTRAVGISLRNPTAIIAREGERPFYPFPSLSGFTTQNL